MGSVASGRDSNVDGEDDDSSESKTLGGRAVTSGQLRRWVHMRANRLPTQAAAARWWLLRVLRSSEPSPSHPMRPAVMHLQAGGLTCT